MKYPLLSVFATLALAASAQASTVIKDFSTGYDDAANVQLANGVTDTDYSIVSGGSAGHVGDPLVTLLDNLPGPYLPDNASTASRWIGINTGAGSFGTDIDAGTYIFQTTATVSAGTDLSMVVIPTLRFAVDDNVLGITINGTSVYTHIDCGCNFDDRWTTLTCLGAGLFQDGVNDIDFTVLNGSGGPMALRVEGQVAIDCACASGAPVPEPASLGLLGAGALALLARRRRH